MVPQDRVAWRAAVVIGAKNYEENRVQCAIETRQRRKCPQWMTPQHSTNVGIVRNRADRSLAVSAMSGAVIQDNSFSVAATVVIDEQGHT